MGRELRMVPKNWQHPKDKNGQYIPLLGYSFKKQIAEWEEEYDMWRKGYKRNYGNGERWQKITDPKLLGMSYEEWAGEAPNESDYMPQWKREEMTHFQMYENTTEGTPISPVMETAEGLARWLFKNKASAFGDETASYNQWLQTIERGFAFSAVATSEGIQSGVAGMAQKD